MPELKRKPLLKANDVKRIKFRTIPKEQENTPLRIGGASFGNIYVGAIKFSNGIRQRIAIKRFKTKLTESVALKYQKIIDDFTNAGVDFPKMGMYLLPAGTRFGNEVLAHPELVQISELYAKRNDEGVLESKIENKTHFWFSNQSKKRVTDALIKYVQIANVGYNPEPDIIEPFIKSDRIMVIDLDLLVVLSAPTTSKQRAGEIIGYLFNSVHTNKEILEIFRILYSIANDEMKPTLLNNLYARDPAYHTLLKIT